MPAQRQDRETRYLHKSPCNYAHGYATNQIGEIEQAQASAEGLARS